MSNENETVFKKYKILDPKTNEEEQGKYFVLKLDSNDYKEKQAVKAALIAYSNELIDSNPNLSHSIIGYAKSAGLDDNNDIFFDGKKYRIRDYCLC